jgi:hypothetical protein
MKYGRCLDRKYQLLEDPFKNFMDIILTGIASVLLIIGFFVICRTSDEEEDDEESTDENPES